MNGGSSASYLSRTPCIPSFCTLFSRGGREEPLDYQGRAGMTLIVQALFEFFQGVCHAIACGHGCGNGGEGHVGCGGGGGFCCSVPQYGGGQGGRGTHTHTHRNTQTHTHTHTGTHTGTCTRMLHLLFSDLAIIAR